MPEPSLHLIAVAPMAQQPPNRPSYAWTGSPEKGHRPARFTMQGALQPRPRTIDLAAIAVRRGIEHRPHRAIVACIRLLIDTCGFPEPLTPRFVKGRRLTGGKAVHADSRWLLDPVERWFENDLPPGEAAAAHADNLDRVRAELTERARQLVDAA